MRMPFGKFRGQPLDDIPSSYFCWLLENCILDARLREAVLVVMARRFGRSQGAPPPRQVACARCARLDVRFAAWYRKWTLRLHPDRGGSNEMMAAFNDARDELESACC